MEEERDLVNAFRNGVMNNLDNKSEEIQVRRDLNKYRRTVDMLRLKFLSMGISKILDDLVVNW